MKGAVRCVSRESFETEGEIQEYHCYILQWAINLREYYNTIPLSPKISADGCPKEHE